MFAGADRYHSLSPLSGAEIAHLSVFQKHYVGWLGESRVIATSADPTGTYRIYDHSNPNLPTDRKVAIQIGEDHANQGSVWLTYRPDAPDLRLETRGLTAHYIDPVRPAASWLLDLTPNSRLSYDPAYEPDRTKRLEAGTDDVLDAAAVLGNTYAIPSFDFEFTVIATGGTGNDTWADVQIKKKEVAVVDLNATRYDYDFGTSGSVVESGYTQLTSLAAGDISISGPVTERDRGATTSSTTVTALYQAEDAAVLSNAVIASSRGGYNGSGYVDYRRNSFVEWNNIDGANGGAATLTFRYANGSTNNRTSDVIVNGQTIATLDFAPTGSWTSWQTTTVSVNLNSGDNTVRVYSPNAGPNLDEMTVETTVMSSGNSDLNRDFVFSSQATTFEHAVRDGLWQVTLTMGDKTNAHDNMVVSTEGITIASDVDAAAGEYKTVTGIVEVTDGKLSLTISDNGGTDANWVLNSMSLEMLENRVDTS